VVVALAVVLAAAVAVVAIAPAVAAAQAVDLAAAAGTLAKHCTDLAVKCETHNEARFPSGLFFAFK
jgi:hypothetical protein